MNEVIDIKFTGTYEFFSGLTEDGKPDLSKKIWEAKNEIQWNFLDHLGRVAFQHRPQEWIEDMWSSWNNLQTAWVAYQPYLFLWTNDTAATKWDWDAFDDWMAKVWWDANSPLWCVKDKKVWPIWKSSIYTYDPTTDWGYWKYTMLFKYTPDESWNIKELWIISRCTRSYNYSNRYKPISRVVPSGWIDVTKDEPIYILYTIAINTDDSADWWRLVWGKEFIYKYMLGTGNSYSNYNYVWLSTNNDDITTFDEYYNTDNHILHKSLDRTTECDVEENDGKKLQGNIIEADFEDIPADTYKSMTVFVDWKSFLRKKIDMEVTDSANLYNVKIKIAFK